MCKGCLPTNYALTQRSVNVEVVCPWCHAGLESDVHVLFTCGFAKTIWITAGLKELIQCSLNDTAVAVIVNIFTTSSKEQRVQVAMICWGLWCRRNKWVWDRINGSVFGVKAAATHLLTDWREAQVKADVRVSIGGEGACIWNKPNDG